MTAETMSITLPAETARTIRAAVESGSHASTSEVIRDAVSLWQERQAEREHRLDAVRAQLDEASRDPRRITDAELGRHFDDRSSGASIR